MLLAALGALPSATRAQSDLLVAAGDEGATFGDSEWRLEERLREFRLIEPFNASWRRSDRYIATDLGRAVDSIREAVA